MGRPLSSAGAAHALPHSPPAEPGPPGPSGRQHSRWELRGTRPCLLPPASAACGLNEGRTRLGTRLASGWGDQGPPARLHVPGAR